MAFASNQILEISGTLDQLQKTLNFVINLYNTSKNDISYQITENGTYCLGWTFDKDWKKYPFDFDIHIISEIIKQHLKKISSNMISKFKSHDGMVVDGFLIKCIPELFSDTYNDIKDPFYGIISIEPFENFYSK